MIFYFPEIASQQTHLLHLVKCFKVPSQLDICICGVSGWGPAGLALVRHGPDRLPITGHWSHFAGHLQGKLAALAGHFCIERRYYGNFQRLVHAIT